MKTIACIFLIITSGSLLADCNGCAVSIPGTHSGGSFLSAKLTKCRAKQKDIVGDTCPRCLCRKTEHSVHRHPFKWHNGAKVREIKH